MREGRLCKIRTHANSITDGGHRIYHLFYDRDDDDLFRSRDSVLNDNLFGGGTSWCGRYLDVTDLQSL